MQATQAQSTFAGSGFRTPRPKILLVDEDPRDLDHYRRILHDSGFQVQACPDFNNAAKLLEIEKFACVVVDQGGQEFKGRAVLERSVERDRYCPVVILSRYHDIGCYIEAMQLGAVDYLEKPLSAVEIVRAVTTYLQAGNAAA